jgi:hypothetical protein
MHYRGDKMTQTEVLRLALAALESTGENNGYHGVTQYFDETMVDQAITAIKAALEAKDEPWEQLYPEMGKPYAFEASMYPRVIIDPVTGNVSIGTPQRTWVGLADEDYIKALELCDFDKDAAFEFFEDKLKELNT